MPTHPKAEELIKEFDKLIEEAENAFNGGYDELREYLNSDKNKLFESFPYPENPYELEPDKIKSFIISAFNLGREAGVAEEKERVKKEQEYDQDPT